ncbi:MAG: hypothetical protein RIC35_21760 [Marinoscillum sp.]
MNKVVIIFAVVFCYFICTISCIETGCYTQQIDSLEVLTGQFIERNGSTFLSPTPGIFTADLGFIIRPSASHYSCEGIPLSAFPLINHAYADEPTTKFTPLIDLITITSGDSLTINGKVFPPATNLSSVFEARQYSFFEDLGKFLQNSIRLSQHDQIELRFSQIPDHPLNHNFLFEVIMSDGVIFHLESVTVKTR